MTITLLATDGMTSSGSAALRPSAITRKWQRCGRETEPGHPLQACCEEVGTGDDEKLERFHDV